MSEPRHTKAPWVSDLYLIRDAYGNVLARFDKFTAPYEETFENCRLAAAAPELLLALNDLLERARPHNLDEYGRAHPTAAAWRAAYRACCKARGLPVPMHAVD